MMSHTRRLNVQQSSSANKKNFVRNQITSIASFSAKRSHPVETLTHTQGGANRHILHHVLDRKKTTMMGSISRGPRTIDSDTGTHNASLLPIPDDMSLQRRRHNIQAKPRRSISGIRAFTDMKNNSALCEQLIKLDVYGSKEKQAARIDYVHSPRRRNISIATHYPGHDGEVDIPVAGFLSHRDGQGNALPNTREEIYRRQRKATSVCPRRSYSGRSDEPHKEVPYATHQPEAHWPPDAITVGGRRAPISPRVRPPTDLLPSEARAHDLQERMGRRQYHGRAASAIPLGRTEVDISRPLETLPSNEYYIGDTIGKRCHFSSAIYQPSLEPLSVPSKYAHSRTVRLHSTNPNVQPSKVFPMEVTQASAQCINSGAAISRKHIIPIRRSSLVYHNDTLSTEVTPAPICSKAHQRRLFVPIQTPKIIQYAHQNVDMTPVKSTSTPTQVFTPRISSAHVVHPRAISSIETPRSQQIMISPRFAHRSPSRPTSGPESIIG